MDKSKGKSACCQTQCIDYHQSGGQEARHTCPRCHRQFFGEQCLGNHYVYSATDGKRADTAKKIKPMCATVRHCPVCNRLLRPHEIETRHVCGTSECPSCKQYHDLTKQQCYIQKPTRPEERRKLLRSRKRKADGSRSLEEKDSLFGYWDSETMQDTGVHVASLVCAATSNCDELFHFEGSTCIEAFLDWLRELAQDFKLTVLAHNSQGFDCYLILDALYRQYVMPDQIVNGAKILSLSIHGGDIVFKDSLCFFQMPLSAFPKASGLVEQKKGFFPHFFNTPDRQDYVGPLPDKTYYDAQGMSVARAQEFERWYDTHDPDYVFHFQAELLAYCESDVLLLKGACQVFCQEFEEISGFNPLKRCITIASACNLFYRTKHMPERQLACEPVSGWHGEGKPYSHTALEWLTYLNHTRGGHIRHACNGGEHVIRQGDKTFRVDGYDVNTHVVREFQGCFWHGCPKCYPDRDKPRHKMSDQTMRDVYKATRRREGALFAMGHSVIVMWECEWEEKKKSDDAVRALVDSFGIVSRLQPRDAFFGGGTNAIKLHHRTIDQEKVHYHDFTSLCTWTNKNRFYLWGILRSISNPEALTSVLSLGWSNVRFYHPMVSIILSYPIATVENSRFPSVEPAWNTNNPNR